MQIDNFFQEVGKSLNFLNTPQKLEAIWLQQSIITEEGRKVRLRPGLKVKVENGQLVDCDKPTYEIVSCFGALTHSFSIKVKSIQTGKEETIYLPNF